MGRSVNYLNNAEVVLFFPFDGGREEDGEYNEDLASLDWEDLMANLSSEIRAKLPSYYKVDKWDNRETKIFLENNLCSIGISEYCGLCSLSVAPKNNEYDEWHERFAIRHANQIEKTLRKVLEDLGLTNLRKVGSMSNGEGVYEKVGV